MREIRFRVWLPNHNIMEEGIELFYSHMIELEDRKQIWVSEEENKVVMQFTGLKDKNGKDIYEGDVINVPYNYIGYVVTKFSEGIFNISKYDVSKCVIVGNIHENLELIK